MISMYSAFISTNIFSHIIFIIVFYFLIFFFIFFLKMIVHCNNADSNLSVGQFLLWCLSSTDIQVLACGCHFPLGYQIWSANVVWVWSQSDFFFFLVTISANLIVLIFGQFLRKKGTEVVMPRPKGYSTHTCFHQLQASPMHRCNLAGPSMDGLGSGGRVLFWRNKVTRSQEGMEPKMFSSSALLCRCLLFQIAAMHCLNTLVQDSICLPGIVLLVLLLGNSYFIVIVWLISSWSLCFPPVVNFPRDVSWGGSPKLLCLKLEISLSPSFLWCLCQWAKAEKNSLFHHIEFTLKSQIVLFSLYF